MKIGPMKVSPGGVKRHGPVATYGAYVQEGQEWRHRSFVAARYVSLLPLIGALAASGLIDTPIGREIREVASAVNVFEQPAITSDILTPELWDVAVYGAAFLSVILVAAVIKPQYYNEGGERVKYSPRWL